MCRILWIGFPWGFLSYLCCGWLCQRKIMHQDMFWVEPRQETHWNYVECIMWGTTKEVHHKKYMKFYRTNLKAFDNLVWMLMSNHYDTYYNNCNQCLVFQVFSVKSCINVASSKYFYMILFLCIVETCEIIWIKFNEYMVFKSAHKLEMFSKWHNHSLFMLSHLHPNTLFKVWVCEWSSTPIGN